MTRPFPALALLAATLLALGLAFPARAGWPAALATLAAHGAAIADLWAAGRRVERAARAAGMPDWAGALAEKNRGKASAYLAWGVPLAVGSGWAGATGRGGAWTLGLSAANLAFQAGAFAGEAAMIAAQARLLRDAGTWAGGDP